jgi:excinuclease ABC subunit C
MNLLFRAKKLPDKPGVYIFSDKKGKPLYIGRTVSLRKRVLSYFRDDIDLRIKEMVSLAYKIRHKKTDNLLEAIILEANLIKKFWPKYNVKDRDDRSFVYIVIPKDEYPRPFIVRGKELDKFPKSSYVFGPYQSASLLESALKIIRRIFPYSTCKPFFGKPCFDYQIGFCPGLCIGKISKADYQKNIKNIILLLSGQKSKLIKKLKKENPRSIKALQHIQDVSLIIREELNPSEEAPRIEGYDISHLAGRETFGAMAVFINGKPDKKEYRLFKIKRAPASDDLRALEEVLERRFGHKEWQFPDFILIDGGKPQVDFVSKFFKREHLNIPYAGISKLGGDRLVYPAKTKKSIKSLAESIKRILIKTRDEAHRFSGKSSRRQRKLLTKH